MSRAAIVVLIAVLSVITVFVTVVWTTMGVWAKWRRGALRLPWPRR